MRLSRVVVLLRSDKVQNFLTHASTGWLGMSHAFIPRETSNLKVAIDCDGDLWVSLPDEGGTDLWLHVSRDNIEDLVKKEGYGLRTTEEVEAGFGALSTPLWLQERKSS